MTTKHRAICASCLTPITAFWRVTEPQVYVICGLSNCERWASSQSLRIAVQGWEGIKRPQPPAPPKPKTKRHEPKCATCRGQLPRRKIDRWGDAQQWCSLTCEQQAQRA